VRLFAIVAVLAALIVTAGAQAAKHKVDSGIRGEATAGPTCPVERYPPDPHCRDRPYQATVRVRRKRTGEAVNYLLPRTTNIRRVHVDNSTTPVTFWVGSNHGASIIKLEPLD